MTRNNTLRGVGVGAGIIALGGAAGFLGCYLLTRQPRVEVPATQPITIVCQDETSFAQKPEASVSGVVPSVAPGQEPEPTVKDEPGLEPEPPEPPESQIIVPKLRRPEEIYEPIPYRMPVRVTVYKFREKVDADTDIFSYDIIGFLDYNSEIRNEMINAFREIGRGRESLPMIKFRMNDLTEEELNKFEEGILEFPFILIDDDVRVTQDAEFQAGGKLYNYIKELYFDNGLGDISFFRDVDGAEYSGQKVLGLMEQKHDIMRDNFIQYKENCELEQIREYQRQSRELQKRWDYLENDP